MMTEYEKFEQIKREAKFTGIALVILIIFWCVAGFGMANVNITIFNLPLWSVAGTVGVWLFAMVLVWFMIHFIFKDMNLEEENIS